MIEVGDDNILEEYSIQNDVHECDHDWEQECEERHDSWWIEDSVVEDTQDIQLR